MVKGLVRWPCSRRSAHAEGSSWVGSTSHTPLARPVKAPSGHKALPAAIHVLRVSLYLLVAQQACRHHSDTNSPAVTAHGFPGAAAPRPVRMGCHAASCRWVMIHFLSSVSAPEVLKAGRPHIAAERLRRAPPPSPPPPPPTRAGASLAMAQQVSMILGPCWDVRCQAVRQRG